MSLEQPIESLLADISQLDRAGCIHELTHFGHLPLDFTHEFLGQMSVERLRHLLLAATLTAYQRRRCA